MHRVWCDLAFMYTTTFTQRSSYTCKCTVLLWIRFCGDWTNVSGQQHWVSCISFHWELFSSWFTSYKRSGQILLLSHTNKIHYVIKWTLIWQIKVSNMHTRQYSASNKRIDTLQWCVIQAPNPCSFPVPADTSFLMESSKKVGKKQKWRLLKFKITRYFHNYRTKHQNTLPSLPLLKNLTCLHSLFNFYQKTEHCEGKWLASHPTYSSALVLFHDRRNLPPSNLPVSGCNHSQVYQSGLTRERLHYLGYQSLKPQGILPYLYLHTVLTAYTTHP